MEEAAAPQQARRANSPCSTLGIGGESAPPSVAALGAGGAARSLAPPVRSAETSGGGVADSSPIPRAVQGRFALRAC
eukprot:7053800-Alexandrium_andersonii.AAC.1